MNKDCFLLERKDNDLPFYNGEPILISKFGWIIIFIFMISGFVYLSIGNISVLSPSLNIILSGIILGATSLIGLMIVTKKHWTSLFRRIRFSDVFIIILSTIIALMVVSFIAFILSKLFPMSENPGVVHGSDNKFSAFLVLTISSIFQLFGEEFLAILPFLALLQYFYLNRKKSRKKSIVLALILSSIFFGLLHLPTYNWNILQCIFVIGFARLFLTIPYIMTRNLFVSFAVHFLYDMIPFLLAFLY